MLKALLCCCAAVALTFAAPLGHAKTSTNNRVTGGNSGSVMDKTVCPSGFDYNLCLSSEGQNFPENSDADVGLRIGSQDELSQLAEVEVDETEEGGDENENGAESDQNQPAPIFIIVR